MALSREMQVDGGEVLAAFMSAGLQSQNRWSSEGAGSGALGGPGPGAGARARRAASRARIRSRPKSSAANEEVGAGIELAPIVMPAPARRRRAGGGCREKAAAPLRDFLSYEPSVKASQVAGRVARWEAALVAVLASGCRTRVGAAGRASGTAREDSSSTRDGSSTCGGGRPMMLRRGAGLSSL